MKTVLTVLMIVTLLPVSARGEPTVEGRQASATASAYLKTTDLPDIIRDAMLVALRQHPEEIRWSGHAQGTLFGIATKPLPTGASRQHAIPAMLNLTHMLAVQELLKAKSLSDRYSEVGLTDLTTLSQAVTQVAGKSEVLGTVEILRHQTTVRDDFAIGYALANSHDLTVKLFEAAELEKVKVAYRDIMHGTARKLMESGNAEDAILLWQHLHDRKLVSQSLYLDAAKCFHLLQQDEDAVHILREAMEAFAAAAPVEFFEKVGDFALTIDLATAHTLAENAYTIASMKLLSSVSTDSQSVQDGLDVQ